MQVNEDGNCRRFFGSAYPFQCAFDLDDMVRGIRFALA